MGKPPALASVTPRDFAVWLCTLASQSEVNRG
jgi:hypothetical protein